MGNAGVNLAGNFLNRCNNRGKRSILMHKIEKRQALESNKKNGNPDKEPVSKSTNFYIFVRNFSNLLYE